MRVYEAEAKGEGRVKVEKQVLEFVTYCRLK